MTLLPRSARAFEFTEHPHLRLPSGRILEARDLTNGINAVMIDCMHGVTTMDLWSSMSRAQWTVHESRAKSGQGPLRGHAFLYVRITESP
jgi:hypothetical protein